MNEYTKEDKADLLKANTPDGKIHIILTYCEDDTETYVHCFRTKEAALEYVKEGIRIDHEEFAKVAPYIHDPEEDCREAEKALNEKGVWSDGQGNTYVYDEQEFTA